MSAPTIRQLPGVPDIYALRFCPGGSEHIVLRHFAQSKWTYQEVGSSSNDVDSIHEFLFRYRQSYQHKLFSPTEAQENYTIEQLGAGVLVAYSAHFFAGLSTRYQRWFIYGLALKPYQFVEVDLPQNTRLAAELEWNGRGVKLVRMVTLQQLNSILPCAPFSTDSIDLLPARMVARPAQICRLTVEGSRVYAMTESHTFMLNRNGNWRLHPGGPPVGDRNCAYRVCDCTVEGSGRIIVRKQEEVGNVDEPTDSDDPEPDICAKIEVRASDDDEGTD